MPSNHDWDTIHSMVSRPSSRSYRIGSNVPPEPNVPRQLCTTTWKPCSARTRPVASPMMPLRPYGVRISTVGAEGRSGW